MVDMQEDYFGKKTKYNGKESLISNINKKIHSYLNLHNYVIYVKNKRKTYTPDFVIGLDIGTPFIFEKEKSSCFSNTQFLDFLKNKQINEIEVCGIDGNCCVKSTAMDSVKNGYKTSISLSTIGVSNKAKFDKTIGILKNNNIDLAD